MTPTVQLPRDTVQAAIDALNEAAFAHPSAADRIGTHCATAGGFLSAALRASIAAAPREPTTLTERRAAITLPYSPEHVSSEQIKDAIAALPCGPSAPIDQREHLLDLVCEHLGDFYWCGRVWNAWNVGTMSQDDFHPAAETDLPNDLVNAVLTWQAALKDQS